MYMHFSMQRSSDEAVKYVNEKINKSTAKVELHQYVLKQVSKIYAQHLCNE